MNRTGLLALLLATLAFGSLSCAAKIGPATGSGPGSAPSVAISAGPGNSGGGATDAHFIEADDVFVAERPLEKAWVSVHLAKMQQAPSAETKNEGRFTKVYDGKELWSRYFWRTRPAVATDLVVGNQVICFDSNKQGDVYRAPRDQSNARRGSWWLARIDDVSDSYKGVVTVARSYHCAAEALRAVVP